MHSTARLNPNLKGFFETRARNYVLYGGRASSKSWHAAGFAIFLAQKYKLRFLCTRQFQCKIAESVFTLLKIQAERFGIADQFKFLESSIVHKVTGSEFVFYGLARNITEIKSLEGIDIAWHEECHLMTKEQWEILDPTLRKQGSQHWIVFNPSLLSDWVYKRFVTNPPPNTIVRKINYLENPFLSQTMLDVIEAAKLEDYDEYQHIYLGEPRQDDDQAIIKRTWILSAIDAHKTLGIEPTGAKRIGFDVADSGEDKCAIVYAHGPVIEWADMWKAREDELLKSCTRVYHEAKERDAAITYDCIGVGASAGAKFDELNHSLRQRVQYQKFNAGGAVFKPDMIYTHNVKNKDMFSNIKAQAWWMLADRFKNTYNAIHNGQKFNDDELISISSDLPYLSLLIDELSTPKRDYDANGKVKVESKKDLDKRDIPSPNLADALVMAFAPSISPMIINPDVRI